MSTAPRSAGVGELEAEMKLLHWHKLANEAALKAALIRTKKLKAARAPAPPPQAPAAHMAPEERVAWASQVIEEEQSKPLQVSREFVMKYEASEREEDERLGREIQGHIASLQRLRALVEERNATRSRTAGFRKVRKELEQEKKQLMMGRLGPATPSPNGKSRQTSVAVADPAESASDPNADAGGALHTVLGSLDKLIQLEKRISNLESNKLCTSENPASKTDASSRSSSAAGTGASATRRLSFTKSRTVATLREPAKQLYTVRPRPQQQRQLPRYMSSNARSRRRSAADAFGGGTGGSRLRRQGRPAPASTFMTSLPADSRRADGGGVRRAVRSSAQQRQSRARQVGGGLTLGGGAGSVSTHRQAFQQLRSEYTRRKEALRKELSRGVHIGEGAPRRVGTYTARSMPRSGLSNAGLSTSASLLRSSSTRSRKSQTHVASVRRSQMLGSVRKSSSSSSSSGSGQIGSSNKPAWGVRGLGVSTPSSSYTSVRGSGAAAVRARRRLPRS
jgi:hypothetical protein